MKKTTLIRAAFVIAFLCGVLFAYSQKPSFSKYYVAMLDGGVVLSALQNPDFHHFVFFYSKDENDVYTLLGQAENSNSNPIGEPIRLRPLSVSVPKRFKNLAPDGKLFLSKQTLLDHLVDGSEDYVLTPRKCIFKDKVMDYVSYRFSNREEPAGNSLEDELLSATLKAFTLNPSPPY